MSRTRLRWAILLCAGVMAASPAVAWAARPLELGFADGAFTGPAAATWLARSAAAGAQIVRIDIGWDAPNTARRPRGFDPRNPADPNYDFTKADAAIRLAGRDGLRILVTFSGAPRWAEGPNPPSGVPGGSWRPDPRALEDYAVALGRRYSGRFPDPENPGKTLPRVAAFQVWNEPNLNSNLNPQWSGVRAAAPGIYRVMLNAFYRGLKSVDPSALVVTAATAPFGDPQPGGNRIMPARFWRDVLCVQTTSAGSLRGRRCRDPARFDVLAHNMYSWGSPTTHALWPDDVAIPDMGKLVAVLRAAERAGSALPRTRHPVWVTEVGYNTKPPNPSGVPLSRDAMWVEETLGELWREGVSAVFWDQVGDQPPVPSYTYTSQSGVYYLGGAPKPALAAFEFPLVAWPGSGPRAEVWGRAPASGRLELEVRSGSSWKALRTLRVRAGSTFLVTLARHGGGQLRARVGNRTSLDWPLR